MASELKPATIHLNTSLKTWTNFVSLFIGYLNTTQHVSTCIWQAVNGWEENYMIQSNGRGISEVVRQTSIQFVYLMFFGVYRHHTTALTLRLQPCRLFSFTTVTLQLGNEEINAHTWRVVEQRTPTQQRTRHHENYTVRLSPNTRQTQTDNTQLLRFLPQLWLLPGECVRAWQHQWACPGQDQGARPSLWARTQEAPCPVSHTDSSSLAPREYHIIGIRFPWFINQCITILPQPSVVSRDIHSNNSVCSYTVHWNTVFMVLPVSKIKWIL